MKDDYEEFEKACVQYDLTRTGPHRDSEGTFWTRDGWNLAMRHMESNVKPNTDETNNVESKESKIEFLVAQIKQTNPFDLATKEILNKRLDALLSWYVATPPMGVAEPKEQKLYASMLTANMTFEPGDKLPSSTALLRVGDVNFANIDGFLVIKPSKFEKDIKVNGELRIFGRIIHTDEHIIEFTRQEQAPFLAGDEVKIHWKIMDKSQPGVAQTPDTAFVEFLRGFFK